MINSYDEEETEASIEFSQDATVLDILDYLEVNSRCPVCNEKIYCLIESSFCPTCGSILKNPDCMGISPCKSLKFIKRHRKPFS